jgi:hypothetical protein
LSVFVVGNDAHMQFGKLVPTSRNTDMANFLSFDVHDINLSKVMNDFNLILVLLQMTNKSIIVIEDFDQFLTERSAVVSLFVDVISIFLSVIFWHSKCWLITT